MLLTSVHNVHVYWALDGPWGMVLKLMQYTEQLSRGVQTHALAAHMSTQPAQTSTFCPVHLCPLCNGRCTNSYVCHWVETAEEVIRSVPTLLTVMFFCNTSRASYDMKHKQSLISGWKVIAKHRLRSSCSKLDHLVCSSACLLPQAMVHGATMPCSGVLRPVVYGTVHNLLLPIHCRCTRCRKRSCSARRLGPCSTGQDCDGHCSPLVHSAECR